MTLGGVEIFSGRSLQAGPRRRRRPWWNTSAAAELYASAPPEGRCLLSPIDFPPHERCVEIQIDLGRPGGASAVVLGADLTHEYVSENADYRS